MIRIAQPRESYIHEEHELKGVAEYDRVDSKDKLEYTMKRFRAWSVWCTSERHILGQSKDGQVNRETLEIAGSVRVLVVRSRG